MSLSATLGLAAAPDGSPSAADVARIRRRTSHSAAPAGAFTNHNLSLKVYCPATQSSSDHTDVSWAAKRAV